MFPQNDLFFSIEPQPNLKKTGLFRSSPELYFRITYTICHRDFIVSGDGTQCICTLHEHVGATTIHFWTNIGLLNGDREVIDKFSQRLSCLGMNSGLEHRLISDVIRRAKRFIIREGKSEDDEKIIRRFNLNMRLDKNHFFDEVDVVMMQSMAEFEESNYGMKPADPSSLSLIKSVKLEGKREEEEEKEEEEEGETCSVCLEELVDVASAMPCAHLFHENCITKWLQTSHVCPVCRFSMPVSVPVD